MNKQVMIKKYFEITCGNYKSYLLDKTEDDFIVFDEQELIDFMKKSFLNHCDTMSFHLSTISEITNCSLEEVEDFVLVETILGNVAGHFLNGKQIKSFIGRKMTIEDVAKNFAKICLSVKDFSDFLSDDYVLVDNMYVFNLYN